MNKKWTSIGCHVSDIGDIEHSLEVFYADKEKQCLMISEHGYNAFEWLSGSIDELIIQSEDIKRTWVDYIFRLEAEGDDEKIEALDKFNSFIEDIVGSLGDLSKLSENYCNLTSLMTDEEGVGRVTLLKLKGITEVGAEAIMSWFRCQHLTFIDEETALIVEPLISLAIDKGSNINEFYMALLADISVSTFLRESVERKKQKVAKTLKRRKTKVLMIQGADYNCDNNVELSGELNNSLSLLASELGIKVVVLGVDPF